MSEYTANDQSIGIDLTQEDTDHLVQSPQVLVVIKKVERQTTKTGKEPIVVMSEVVSDGLDKGKILFDRIFDRLPDSKTGEAMNKRRLRSLGVALGLQKINSTADLMVHGKIIMAEVAIKHNVEYGSSNEVRSYSAVNANQVVLTPSTAPVAPVAPTVAPTVAPAVAPNIAPPIAGATDEDVF